MLPPADTGSAWSSFVTDRSACGEMSVAAVALLFAVFGSAVADETVAVLKIVVVGAVSSLTFTTIVKVAEAPAAGDPIVAVTVPVPPAGGVVSVNVGPLSWVADTNVVLAGTSSSISTDEAGSGPLLVTVTA